MREGLSRIALGVALAILGVVVWAQSEVTYLNGVPYVFPSAQGSADENLTASDGSGTLDWTEPPNSTGLSSGHVVLSTVACPTGWTRVSGADGRFLRGSTTWGTTGGSDTHTHTLSGILSSQSVGVSGSTGGATPSLSGSLASASISHAHGTTPSTGGADDTFPDAQAAIGISIYSSDPSHSHGLGTLGFNSHTHGAGSLAGGSHGHAVGTYTLAAGSSVPAYYNIIVCEKD